MEQSTVTFTPLDDFASGTCLQHAGVELSYSDLCLMFGKPMYEGIGDKTTTEWTIEYQKYDAEWDEYTDGKFTIYDWHFARKLGDDYAKTKWNIGGKTINDYFAFMEAMELFENHSSPFNDGILIGSHVLPEVGAVA